MGVPTHTHPKNANPAYIDLYNNHMYPSAYIPEYNYVAPEYQFKIYKTK